MCLLCPPPAFQELFRLLAAVSGRRPASRCKRHRPLPGKGNGLSFLGGNKMKSSAKTAEGQTKGPASRVTLKTIQQAAKRIRNSIYLSPFMRSETFSQLTGNSLFLKLENLQMTGSFKERGALNKILLLTPDERRRGVIAASAGNHAQAVAYHASKRGIASQIVMPLTTPLVKVS